MKKIAVIILSLTLVMSLAACAKSENRADTSLEQGETSISGKVESVSGNSLLICDDKGARYVFSYSVEVTVVCDGWYVVDLSADSFNNKDITVICSQQILETYPMQLQNVRMIITEGMD